MSYRIDSARRAAAHAGQTAWTRTRRAELADRYDAPCHRGAADCPCRAHPVPEAGHGH